MRRIISRKDVLSPMARPVDIMFCYAHSDDEHLQQLKNHLSPLERTGLVRFWHDRMVAPGKNYHQVNASHLNTAQLILILVSSDFLSSNYSYDVELTRALERRAHDEVEVIPIILRPCLWQVTPLGPLKALPSGDQPVIDPAHSSADQAWLSVVKGIETVARDLQSRAPIEPEIPPSVPPVPASAQPPGSNPAQPSVQNTPGPGQAVAAIDAALQAFQEMVPRIPPEIAPSPLLVTQQPGFYHLVREERVRGAVTALALAVNGTVLFAGGADGDLMVWDVSSVSSPPFVGHTMYPGGRFDALALSRDEQTLAVGHSNGMIGICRWQWDASNAGMASAVHFLSTFREHTWRSFRGHAGEVPVLAFTGDGSMLVSGGKDRALWGWELVTNRGSVALGSYQGTRARLVLVNHIQTLIGANEAGKIRTWDMSGRQQSAGRDGSSEPMTMTALALSADESTLAWSDRQGTIYIHKTPFQKLSSDSARPSISGQAGEITHLALSDDGSILFWANSDGALMMRDIATYQLSEIPRQHHGRITVLVCKDDALACGDEQGSVSLWRRER